MNKNLPPVHVLMPVYNAAPFLTKAMSSVIQQNYSRLKLIIIDDGSTDDSPKIANQFLESNKRHPIDFIILPQNKGITRVRQELLEHSKTCDPQAYIFWLDADDQYTDPDFIDKAIHQMLMTRADICLINFSITYEHESQLINAAGLLRDQENTQRLCKQIYHAPQQAVSPMDVTIFNMTSLGCTKIYSPRISLPNNAANAPFSDFVAMAALLQAKLITALNPEYQPLCYLRRSTSITGNRTAAHFLEHLPNQLLKFMESVSLIKQDDQTEERLKAAQEFIRNKFAQYQLTLKSLVNQKSHPDLNESTLLAYEQIIKSFPLANSIS